VGLQRDAEALKVARSVLRKDPEFLDMRCATTAFLWAMGETAAAEGEWNQLQQAQGVLLLCMISQQLLLIQLSVTGAIWVLSNIFHRHYSAHTCDMYA
jgi:hypothetical protein